MNFYNYAGGHRFESCILHQKNPETAMVSGFSSFLLKMIC